MLIHLRSLFTVCFFLLYTFQLHAQVSINDQTEADGWARKYKEDDVLCRSSYHFYTFDKGVNALNDKVVVVQEDTELEFMALKKFSGLSYAEYYNKFIKLKTFKKEVKIGNKYITSGKAGIDRSLTDENIFFDDGRVQYYPIRFSEKGSVSRIIVKKEFGDAKLLTRIFFTNHIRLPNRYMNLKYRSGCRSISNISISMDIKSKKRKRRKVDISTMSSLCAICRPPNLNTNKSAKHLPNRIS
jgi:hypothetical protein